MRMALAPALASVFLISPISVAAAEYDQQIERFFATVKAGKTDDALDQLFGTNPWLERTRSDQLQNARTQLGSIQKLVGALMTYEKIQEVKVGTRFVHVVYLVLYEREAIRFEFTLFRPASAWVLHSFYFDEEVPKDVRGEAHRSVGRQ